MAEWGERSDDQDRMMIMVTIRLSIKGFVAVEIRDTKRWFR